MTADLRYGEDKIVPYEQQLATLVSKGFAVWDIIQSCRRKGSLDSNIQDEQPNAIREFCQEHDTIQRIVFANGGSQCKIFNRHFKDWWKSGHLQAAAHPVSQEHFKTMTKFAEKTEEKYRTAKNGGRIECLSALSVSPAGT